ncbi:hypothetical protein [Frigoriflavimonas asaccharolytica]|uniref:Lipoprotein n=1 Tax=Frigoriflavimonas asaccharolytica TaxID=2735899 RepID=A0A8J8G8W6_9FLAO|nr:hypothetical protein [Frigoriflavimonas asaccharolytica]NRS93476.1 hypothetical protein [Frigoriflavimonas asaccharolytica]
MRIAFIFFILIISSCNKKEIVKEYPLIHERYFSVSELEGKIDSIGKIKKIKSGGPPPEFGDEIDKRYLLGAIHFIVEDSLKSRYVINYLEPSMMNYLIIPPSKEDSLFQIQECAEIIRKAKSISTSKITSILGQNRVKIAYNISRRPLLITFALKNDTL